MVPQNVELKNSYYSSGGILLSIILFLVVKSVVYNSRIGAGLDHNTFFNHNRLLTHFYIIDVVLGLVILSFLYLRLKKNSSKTIVKDVAVSSTFRYRCNPIWLLLFPVMYLLFEMTKYTLTKWIILLIFTMLAGKISGIVLNYALEAILVSSVLKFMGVTFEFMNLKAAHSFCEITIEKLFSGFYGHRIAKALIFI